MKKLLLSVILVVQVIVVVAKCSSGGIEIIFPQKLQLERNGIIVLKFYGQAKYIFDSLNVKYFPLLISSHDSVKLKIDKKFIGGHSEYEIILTPIRTLAKSKYQLKIVGLSQHDYKLYFWDKRTDKSVKPIFRIITESENEFPVLFDNCIVEKEKYYEKLGCGPASNVVFSICGVNLNNYIVKVDLKPKDSNIDAKSYLVNIYNNTIIIGYGMCYGAFDLVSNQEYELKLTLVNGIGKMKSITKAFQFTAPNSR